MATEKIMKSVMLHAGEISRGDLTMPQFILKIDLGKSKHMRTHIHVAKALRELSNQFYYSCEHFPHGAIMDTENDEVVGHYEVRDSCSQSKK